MKIELKDKYHGKERQDMTYIHNCMLEVKETDDDKKVTETEEFGYIIQGKDMLYLNAPKVYLPNLPTEHQDIAGAFEEVLGKLQNEEGGDWQPPDIPEPEAYEIYLLIEVVDVSDNYTSKMQIEICKSDDLQKGWGQLEIDWGDGTVEAWTEGIQILPDYPDYYDWGILVHNYTEVGRYLIKITATEYSCFLQRLEPIGGMQYAKVIGAKLGSEIIINNGNDSDPSAAFYQQIRLLYVKLNGKGGLPRLGFYNCYSLMRIDMTIAPEKIYPSQFYNCVNLKNFDFSKITEIPVNGLYGAGFTKLDLPKCVNIGNNGITGCKNLKKITAPLCSIIGDYGLQDCYGLEDAEFSEECTFGTNCFQNCYSLFPRPDGSVN